MALSTSSTPPMPSGAVEGGLLLPYLEPPWRNHNNDTGSHNKTKVNHNRRKLTLAHCLRSKRIPSPQVEQLVVWSTTTTTIALPDKEQSPHSSATPSSVVPIRVDRHELQLALTAIRSTYFVEPMQTAAAAATATGVGSALAAGPSSTPPPTTAFLTTPLLLERVATLGKFVQLLLEFNESVSPSPPATAVVEVDGSSQLIVPSGATTTSTATSMALTTLVNPSQTGDVQICTMITETIRAVTTAVCDAVVAVTAGNTGCESTHHGSRSGSSIGCSFDDPLSAVAAANESYTTRDIYDDDSADRLTVGVILVMAFGTLQRLDAYCNRPFLLSVLWKSLGEMAERATLSHILIPTPLIQQAIVSLTKLVYEGLQSLLLESGRRGVLGRAVETAASEQRMTLKILAFVVLRLTALVKVPTAAYSDVQDDDDEHTMFQPSLSSPMGSTISILTTLRGLMVLYESVGVKQSTNEQILQPYRTLATKLDTAMATWMQTQHTVCGSFDGVMLRILQSNKLDNDETINATASEMFEASFYLGKVMFLTNVLRDAVSDASSDWSIASRNESFLLVIEELLLRSMPAAVVYWDRLQLSACDDNHSPNRHLFMCANSLESVSDALVRIDIGMVTSTGSQESSTAWHRRFDRLLVSWLHVSSSDADQQQKHALCRELVLAVVQQCVRLAMLPSRQIGTSISKKTACPPFLALVVRLFLDAQTIHSLRATISSLLTRLLLDKTIQPALGRFLTYQFAGISKYVPGKEATGLRNKLNDEDMIVILQVMDKLDCGQGEERLSNIKRAVSSSPVIRQTAVRVVMSNYVSTRALTDTLDSFLALWEPRRFEELSLIAWSLVLQTRKFCCSKSVHELSDRETEEIIRFISAMTEERVLAMASRSEKLCPAMFEAIRVLGVLGSRLQASTPQIVVDQLAKCFYTTLSSKSWVVREISLASLVQFASTLPSTHNHVLRSCVPKEMRNTLQCRIQGSRSGNASQLASLRSACHLSLLSTLDLRQERRSTLFPVLSSLTVAKGSYIVRMPTQGGRSAIVIFPPGNDSLADIHFMIGGCDDSQSTGETKQRIQTVKHAMVLQDGGCQMQLVNMV